MKVQIYQLEDMNFALKQIDFVIETQIVVHPNDYQLAFEYEEMFQADFTDFSILNLIMHKFNVSDRPNAEKMRSLSVSDVVRLEDRYYLCNTLGWKEIRFIDKETVEIK